MSQTTSPAQAGIAPFPVIEFRRYTIKPGKREQFARYFETFFPEAFQQLGAMALGQFLERGQPNGFTWIRGFPDMETRAVANAAFYYGPVWKEHKATLNGLMDDSDNVLLMHPLQAGRGLPALPAVDPVQEPNGAQGVMIAQLFSMKPGCTEQFALEAEKVLARYRESGIRETAVLVTLDAANNFPQLPIRNDGPHLLWLGMVANQAMLEAAWRPIQDLSLIALRGTGLLRQDPETIIMDPARRSRLRWRQE